MANIVWNYSFDYEVDDSIFCFPLNSVLPSLKMKLCESHKLPMEVLGLVLADLRIEQSGASAVWRTALDVTCFFKY